ncbi:hypothetical protein J2067_005183 [Erwinia rhapontici]|nr:hypothetical protein [Erwinia rhapontici]
MNPSPLTGERLANALEYRHTFFFNNPHQRVLQFGPASGSLKRDSGQHNDCCTGLPGRGLTALVLHDDLPPVNDKKGVVAPGASRCAGQADESRRGDLDLIRND